MSPALNTRYVPYHRDICTAALHVYTLGTAMYQAIINHPIWSATLCTECEVQDLRGSRAQTGTVKGPNRGGHYINLN